MVYFLLVVKLMNGTIKWYDTKKGYGFIQSDDAEKDVFLHRSVVPEGIYLNDGDNVEFEVEETERGLQATSIKKL